MGVASEPPAGMGKEHGAAEDLLPRSYHAPPYFARFLAEQGREEHARKLLGPLADEVLSAIPGSTLVTTDGMDVTTDTEEERYT